MINRPKKFRSERTIGVKLSSRRSGFTLIELMVAMGMTAVIALSLFGTLRIAFKAQANAEANVEPGRTIDLAMDLLRTDFQNAISPNAAAAASTSTTTTTTTTATPQYLAGPFNGSQAPDDRGHPSADVVFCTTADGPLHPNPTGTLDPTGDGDIRQVELTVITLPGTQDHVLVRRVIGNLLGTQQVDPDDEVVLRGVSSFTVEYSDGTTWLPSWASVDQDNTIPTAVRVTIELERPSEIMNNQGVPVLRYTRVFLLPCSTAATDPNLSSFGGLLN